MFFFQMSLNLHIVCVATTRILLKEHRLLAGFIRPQLQVDLFGHTNISANAILLRSYKKQYNVGILRINLIKQEYNMT